MAMSNSAATLCGILSPLFSQSVAHSTGDPTRLREQWQLIFSVAAGVHVAGAAFFAVFARADEQPWARDGGNETSLPRVLSWPKEALALDPASP